MNRARLGQLLEQIRQEFDIVNTDYYNDQMDCPPWAFDSLVEGDVPDPEPILSEWYEAVRDRHPMIPPLPTSRAEKLEFEIDVTQFAMAELGHQIEREFANERVENHVDWVSIDSAAGSRVYGYVTEDEGIRWDKRSPAAAEDTPEVDGTIRISHSSRSSGKGIEIDVDETQYTREVLRSVFEAVVYTLADVHGRAPVDQIRVRDGDTVVLSGDVSGKTTTWGDQGDNSTES